VIDYRDLDRSAEFWGERFGSVPEAKSGKNRLHRDLRTVDLAGEVERVLALGSQTTHQPARDRDELALAHPCRSGR
jgi:hypothetical protein